MALLLLFPGVIPSGVPVQSHRGSGSRQGSPGGEQVWPFVKVLSPLLFTCKLACLWLMLIDKTRHLKITEQTVFTLLRHHFCKYLSPSLNSDGEETNTADNSEEIYYSLNYEADLLFTRFDSCTGGLHVEKMMKCRFILEDNKWRILLRPKGIASVSVWPQIWAGFGGAWSYRSSLQFHFPGEMCSPLLCLFFKAVKRGVIHILLSLRFKTWVTFQSEICSWTLKSQKCPKMENICFR